jgi:hypothetical protein
MQTCFSSDDPESLPIPCTIVVHDENRIGRGTIWGFYPGRCHVESEVVLSAGLVVSLSLHVPGAATIILHRALVVWSSRGEFGIRFAQEYSTAKYERNTP